jgi:hypothetical protein
MTEREPYQDPGGLHGLPFECTRLAEVDGRTSHHVCVNHEMLPAWSHHQAFKKRLQITETHFIPYSSGCI